MKYFFSGLDPRYAQIFWPPIPDTGLMFSATTLHLPEMRSLCRLYRQAGVSVVLDCGMVQGLVTEDEYIEMLCAWGDAFTWFASIDSPGSLGETNRNYHSLRDYLPADLWGKLLYVLQGDITQGFTDDQYRTLMTVREQATPFLGIGGLVRYCRRGHYAAVERYLDHMVSRMGAQMCRSLHLFGMGNYRILHRYRDLFGSADSSTYLCGVHGERLQEHGGRRPCERPFDPFHLLRDNAAMLSRWCATERPSHAGIPVVRTPTLDPYFLDTWYP